MYRTVGVCSSSAASRIIYRVVHFNIVREKKKKKHEEVRGIFEWRVYLGNNARVLRFFYVEVVFCAAGRYLLRTPPTWVGGMMAIPFFLLSLVTVFLRTIFPEFSKYFWGLRQIDVKFIRNRIFRKKGNCCGDFRLLFS